MSQERSSSMSGRNSDRNGDGGSKKKQRATHKLLEAYNIHVPQIFIPKLSPEGFQKMFQLIHDTKNLKRRHLGRQFSSQASSVNPNFEAIHDYEKKLKTTATFLRDASIDPQRPNDNEKDLISQFQSLVFSRFKRELGERKEYNYCYICQCPFPAESRPMINRYAKALRSQRYPTCRQETEKRLKRLPTCQLLDKHFNLSELNAKSELVYFDDDCDISETKKGSHQTPDLTIGLLTYDVKMMCYDPRAKDRVEPFDRKFLENLFTQLKEEKKIDLQHPFRLNKNSHEDDAPRFPFGIWEAKKSGGDGNHQSALVQSARKVRSYLRLQCRLFENAAKEESHLGEPLVWLFTSIGCSWELYACYVEECKGDQYYIFTPLWAGNTKDVDGAVQLIYINEIIAVWAEQFFKPTVSFCLSLLHASLEPNSRKAQKISVLPITALNIPWLFDLRRRKGGVRTNPSDKSRSRNLTIPSASDRSVSQGRQRSKSPLGDDSIIPELDKYIWIKNRDYGHGDVLVISINTQGVVQNPLIIFDSTFSDAAKDTISRLETERRMYHRNTQSEFVQNEEGIHYIKFSNDSELSSCMSTRNQFYLLCSLDRKKYGRLKEDAHKQPVSPGEIIFDELEAALNVEDLLEKVNVRHEQWCVEQCLKSWNAFNSGMIFCQNTKCDVGWFHCKCVGVEEYSDKDRVWMCDKCEGIPDCDINTLRNWDNGENIMTDNDNRIHRTRSIAKAWEKHKWPEPESILDLFETISSRMEIDAPLEQLRLPLPKNKSPTDLPGSWVVPRNDLDQVVRISSPLSLFSLLNGVGPATLIVTVGLTLVGTWVSTYFAATSEQQNNERRGKRTLEKCDQSD